MCEEGRVAGAMVRLFVAIDFPAGLRERLRTPQEILKQSRARLSLVDPAIIHITLKFIGEVPPERVEQIITALETIKFEPFHLRITGIGSNNPRKPRVIWCTIEDAGKSAALHDRIESVLEPFGIPGEGRAFRPHATLARVKQYDPSLTARLRDIPPMDYGSCTVRSWQLKKSILTPQGPVYETILEVPCA
jgi:2'-5' RNA ligase